MKIHSRSTNITTLRDENNNFLLTTRKSSSSSSLFDKTRSTDFVYEFGLKQKQPNKFSLHTKKYI